MGAQTAGAYLQEVRERRGLSRAAVAKALNSNESQIERCDYGSTRVNGELLISYARYIGANMGRFIALLLDEPLTDESFWVEFDQLDPDQKQAVINVIRQMTRGK